MEAIEVIARFDLQGKIVPVSFTWQGVDYPVASTGRRWQDGDSQHILVMTPADKVYELVYVGSLGRWFLGKYPHHLRTA